MQTILIGFIIGIVLGYLLIWGLAHAASKRRKAWERENKKEWETWTSEKLTPDLYSSDFAVTPKSSEPGRQAQWEKLAEICEQKTPNELIKALYDDPAFLDHD